MKKTLVIVQSCYIPWKGYFDLARSCDEFVLFDDIQFTRRDWRSRNRIKTAQGPLWLSIPVENKGRYHQLINEVLVADPSWAERHWESIRHAYGRAPCFGDVEIWLCAMYERAARETHLSMINRLFISEIGARLGIAARYTWSQSYPGREHKDDRLIDICRQAGATDYVSGPAARAYIDPAKFAAAGISLRYFSYDGYAEHPQLHGAFDQQVSIIDSLAHLGADPARIFARVTPS
ncbi:MAG: WbqC family protein [Alphaproteobacteria bacterium]|nr:WbqC family protein [Alphaproteobacteria bacterium]